MGRTLIGRDVARDRTGRRAAPAVALALVFSAGLFFPLSADSSSTVRIHVDGRTHTVPASVDTVREALVAARVRVGEDDEVSPPLRAPLPEDGIIRVARVSFTTVRDEARIPYKVVVRPTTKGQNPYHPTVVRQGRAGLKRVTYRVKLVDGRESGRSVVEEEVVQAAEPQIVVARNPQALGGRGAYAGQRTLRVLASAYDPGPGSCGKYANGRTCNGKRAGYGIVAVDPKLIPLGSKLHIPGYGYGIAADVGGAIKGNRIDLGFNSRSGALQWGKKWVEIRIVD